MASANIETVGQTGDLVKSIIAGLLVILSVIAFYFLSDKGGIAQWASLLGGLILAVVVFFTSIHGKQLVAFGKDNLIMLGLIIVLVIRKNKSRKNIISFSEEVLTSDVILGRLLKFIW